MALSATIYKAEVQLSNVDDNIYDTLSLTIAQHPSETLERVAARLLAYCLHYRSDSLSFTKGLSTTDEPDLWEKDLTGTILHWIEVGHPEADRIKYAKKRADKVSVYCFAKSSNTWWQKQGEKIKEQQADAVWQFNWEDIENLAQQFERSIDLTVTISEGIIYLSLAGEDINLSATRLL